MIEINNLTKRYKNLTALDDVSLQIKSGEFFGLLGPNGAGKSTMMNLLAGYIEADGGSIRFDGEVFTRDSVSLRRKIGLAPQSLALYEDVSAETNLRIFGSLYLMNKNELKNIIGEKLNSAGLYERRKDLVKTFSGGMKRRLNLIAALLHSPEILLCDEPTVGVDPQSRNAIFDFLRKINDENSITVVYTTHYMEEAERLCKRIAIIDAGKIIALGTKDELLNILPYKEEIVIVKNEKTISVLNLPERMGEISVYPEKYVVKMNNDAKMSEIFKLLEDYGLDYNSIDFRKPTIEELFLNLTGKRLRD